MIWSAGGIPPRDRSAAAIASVAIDSFTTLLAALPNGAEGAQAAVAGGLHLHTSTAALARLGRVATPRRCCPCAGRSSRVRPPSLEPAPAARPRLGRPWLGTKGSPLRGQAAFIPDQRLSGDDEELRWSYPALVESDYESPCRAEWSRRRQCQGRTIHRSSVAGPSSCCSGSPSTLTTSCSSARTPRFFGGSRGTPTQGLLRPAQLEVLSPKLADLLTLHRCRQYD